MGHQEGDYFDASNDDGIIDRIMSERNDVRIRVNTMAIIENLPITNTDLPNNVLSHLLIRYNYVVSSLTGSNSKVVGRRYAGRNKSTIDKIKHLLNDCGSLS